MSKTARYIIIAVAALAAILLVLVFLNTPA
jgi:hypothetical protein